MKVCTRIALCENVKIQIFFAKFLRVLESIYTDAHCQGERQTEPPHFLSSSPHNGWAPTLSIGHTQCSVCIIFSTYYTEQKKEMHRKYYLSCPLVLTMDEHLPSAMHRTGDMLNICNACYYNAYYLLWNEIKTQSLQYDGWAVEHIPSAMVKGCTQFMLHVSIYHYEIRSNHNDMFL